MQEKLDGQYQKVALALAAGVREGRLRSVVFTGPTKKQGTTSTVLNVARQLKASYGINALVVELNRSRPAFVRLFQLDERKSVAAVAGGKSSLDCVQRGADDLSLIPVGDFTSVNSRASAVLSEAVGKIQLELGRVYPVILWDAPPVLEQPDVLFLRSVLSNAVLVVESGRVGHETLERVSAEFVGAGIILEGTIMVNHTKPIPGWIYRWLIH
jgi:Mrp family chromosome partitioning ATPase